MYDSDRKAGWMTLEDEGFIGLIGPIYYLPFENDGTGRFRFLAEQKHQNRAGFVHGGMLMAFADRGLGYTARQHDPSRSQATMQLDMHFIKPARIGDIVEMSCRVIRETRTVAFVDGEIVVGSEVVATARGVWKVIDGRAS